MTFLPETSTLLTYSLACLVLFITPGPDMSLFLAKTMAGGRRAGIASMLGAMAGCCVHTLLAALGLSALLAASVTAFTVLKVVGALYLLWLAFDAVRNGSALSVKDEKKAELPFWKTFLVGVGINLTNPKIVLFFVTFLPQFVQPGDPYRGPEAGVSRSLLHRSNRTHGGDHDRFRRPGDLAAAQQAEHDADHRLYVRGPVLGLRHQDLGDVGAVADPGFAPGLPAGDRPDRRSPATAPVRPRTKLTCNSPGDPDPGGARAGSTASPPSGRRSRRRTRWRCARGSLR